MLPTNDAADRAGKGSTLNKTPNTLPESKPAPSLSWRHIGGFLAGAFLLLAVLQVIGNHKRDASMKWFDLVLEDPSPTPYQVLMIGTSRVAASIRTEDFDKEVSTALGSPFRSLNLGMGFTNMAEYYFALRAIRDQKPEALQGATILIEVPRGLPEYMTWDDDWIVSDGTEPLARYLRPADLPEFLARSKTPFVNKTTIVARVLFGYREGYSRIRGSVFRNLKNKLDPEEKTDLSDVGGIRTDSAGIRTVRAAAIEVANKAIEDTTPWVGYGSTILKQVIDLVRESGGTVYLFDMPISETQAAPRLTPQRLREKALFEAEARSWGIPILQTGFQSTDADYPDYWHLSSKRSGEFSRLLASAFLSARSSPP